MNFSRRFLLKSTGVAAVGLGLAPGFFGRALAQTNGSRKKVLVTIFQRGAADGLSMVPPYGDPHYATLRPNIGVPAPGSGDGAALDLDGHFGLHPALAPLKPFWDQSALAIVHGVGLTGATRSHFDAQDFLDTGTPGVRATPDGWVNRAMQQEDRAIAKAAASAANAAFRAIAVQPAMPRSLSGTAPALAIDALQSFRIGGKGGRAAMAAPSFDELYSGAVDEALRTTGDEAFEALRSVDELKLADAPPQNGATYPKGPLAKRLQDIARLIRADVGLEFAVTEVGGWDTHVNQGAGTGQLANRLKDFGEAIAAFAQDLGDRMADVCVVTMTEFGRTAHENGNRGTDHGSGSAMFVLGGAVKGKRVLGGWKPLAAENLFEARDLPVWTDIRGVLCETLNSHLGVGHPELVFPNFTPTAPVKLFV